MFFSRTDSESYQAMKRRHEKRVNAFPIKFAFNKRQFDDACESLEVTDPKKELLSIGQGGFIRKSDKQSYFEMFEAIDAELDAALENEAFLIDALLYEMGNHEYVVTGDPEDTLRVLGVSLDDKRVNECFQIAKQQYLKQIERW